MIYIIGLGPNDSSNIKENIKQLLLDNTNAKVIARTKEHPAISLICEVIVFSQQKKPQN